MTTPRNTAVRTLLTIVALGLFALPATGQSLAARPSDGQFRDVVFAPNGQTFFAAAYDRNEVWEINRASGEQVRAVVVGRGPAHLALSTDGRSLACVNSLEGSLSIISLDAFVAAAPIVTGEGACAVAPLPGGRFAVANAFADTVSLVDPAQPANRFEFAPAGSVPNAVAASPAHLAVATRVPSAVHFYTPGSRQPAASVSLDTPVTAIAALADDRFVLATASRVMVVTAGGSTVASKDLAATAVAASNNRFAVLTGGAAQFFDSSFQPAAPAMAVSDASAATIALAGSDVVVASAKSRSWFAPTVDAAPAAAVTAPEPVASAAPEPAPAPAPAPAPRPEPAPAPLPAEPAPMVEEQEAAPVAAEPVEVAAEPAPVVEPVEEPKAAPEPEEAPMAEPVAVAAAEPAEEPAAALNENASPVEAPAEPAREPIADETPDPQPAMPAETVTASASSDPNRPPTSTIREVPLRLDRPRAPRTPRRPAEAPLPEDDQPTLFQGLAGMRPFGTSEGGFVFPDLESLDNRTTALKLEGNYQSGSMVWEGNVRFEQDGTLFTMDRLMYNSETSELHAIGNVVVTQGQSKLTADDIYFLGTPVEPEASGEGEEAAAETEAAPGEPAPVTGTDDAPQRQIGFIQAENVHVIEPLREFTAAYLEYNFQSLNGIARAAQGQIGVFYFGAEEIVLSGETAIDATDVWITTCDCDHDYYKLRFSRATLSEDEVFVGKTAQLELFGQATPLLWPRWHFRGPGSGPSQYSFDFDSGSGADLGYYVNIGQTFAVTPYLDLGFRLYPTQKKGVGFGFEGQYDYRDNPASPFYRSRGEFKSMYTTEKDGYIEWYHKQDIAKDTVLTAQWEQWFTEDFVKDFYYDEEYRNRTEPRTFANVTHTKPRYIATGTIRKTTNDDVAETERLPEASFHLLERPIFENLYVTYDGIAGYNEREPSSDNSARFTNVGRISYDWDMGSALTVVPYLELDATWYSDTWDRDGGSDGRFSPEFGITAQTRLQRTYPGAFGFSAFKHIVIPSITYSYRDEPNMTFEETPRFDAYDNIFGRSRIETKLSNVVFGRDAETEEVWQVARLTLYQGNDFWNEFREAQDYEIEIDIRPRPEWGVLMVGELHKSAEDFDLDDPFPLQRAFLELYENVFNQPYDREASYRYNSRFGDYSRVLSYVYYDDAENRWNGRLGFSYAETQNQVFNREILYGLGYEINEIWSVAFEHRYDLERDELARQSYEIHRVFNCLETSLEFRERNSGWDVRLAFSLSAFPGTGVRF